MQTVIFQVSSVIEMVGLEMDVTKIFYLSDYIISGKALLFYCYFIQCWLSYKKKFGDLASWFNEGNDPQMSLASFLMEFLVT